MSWYQDPEILAGIQRMLTGKDTVTPMVQARLERRKAEQGLTKGDVDIAGARQAQALKDSAEGRLVRDDKREQEAYDPASPRSKTAHQVFDRVAQKLGIDPTNMSAADLERYQGVMDRLQGHQVQAEHYANTRADQKLTQDRLDRNTDINERRAAALEQHYTNQDAAKMRRPGKGGGGKGGTTSSTPLPNFNEDGSLNETNVGINSKRAGFKSSAQYLEEIRKAVKTKPEKLPDFDDQGRFIQENVGQNAQSAGMSVPQYTGMAKNREITDKERIGMQAGEDAIQTMERVLKEKPNHGTGIIESAWKTMLNTWAPESLQDPAFAAFKVMAGRQLADYIHQITGAAMGEAEAKRLIQNLPSADSDDDKQFMAKGLKVLEELREKQKLYIDMMAQSGKAVPNQYLSRIGGAPAPTTAQSAPQASPAAAPPPGSSFTPEKAARRLELQRKLGIVK
jgi:hypothetical protein